MCRDLSPHSALIGASLASGETRRSNVQGDIEYLSSRSIVDTRVLKVLPYSGAM
uniref:Uncharacterized protein n=1 Tax=Anguilla anguilla TaxID=7936 RepID=A0A0E9SN07_ANGAN